MAIQMYIVFLWIKWLNVNYLDISINYTSIKINSKLHLIIIIQQKVWLKVKKRLLFVTLNRIVLISSLHYTTYILHCLFVCLSHWFALSTMCLMPLYPFLYYYFFIFFYYYFFLRVLCIFVIVAFLCTYMCIYIYIYIYILVVGRYRR